ncbi:MAG: hypothetical protein MRJ66_14715 [Nitrospira sp.]|nr:hypothetical protein [Nitrospira sp.]
MMNSLTRRILGSSKVHWLIGACVLGAMTACSPRIVAEGVHVTLPDQGMLIGVWGTHPTVEHTAILWLRKRGLRVMDPSAIRANLTHVSTTSVASNEESILEVAEKHGLQEMVFVRLVGDQRAPGVIVRAVTLPDRQVTWVGNARYDSYVSTPTVNHLVVATCRAMAAAWRQESLSDRTRCVLDQNQ